MRTHAAAGGHTNHNNTNSTHTNTNNKRHSHTHTNSSSGGGGSLGGVIVDGSGDGGTMQTWFYRILT